MNQIIPQSKPATYAETSVALEKLFKSGMPFQRGTNPDTVAAVYLDALRGYSIDAIHAGIDKFLRGECDGVSLRYIPTPPELARIVRNAVVPTRFPPERRLPAHMPPSDAERARMRLKMPMYQYAVAHGKIADLARANIAGIDAMILLASEWGIPIPDELADQTDEDWQTARRRAWAEIERDPPKFMKNKVDYFLATYGGH